jgi:hypothetical protein
MNTANLEQSLQLMLRFLIYMVLFFLALGISVLIYVFIKAVCRGRRAARAEKEDHKEKFRSDGTALPPFGRGFCDNCSGAFDKVYHLSSGTRLCPDCFRGFEEMAPA